MNKDKNLKTKKIRTFIAIKISSDLEKALQMFIQTMQPINGNVKWVKPVSLHLTLMFLGDISPHEQQCVVKGIAEVAEMTRTFSLSTAQKGAFPDFKHPQIFWMGVKEDHTSSLVTLQKNITDQMVRCGFKKEKRPFTPHLTLGRVRRLNNIKHFTREFRGYPFPELEFKVEEVFLMESKLTPQGAIYIIQESFTLKI